MTVIHIFHILPGAQAVTDISLLGKIALELFFFESLVARGEMEGGWVGLGRALPSLPRASVSSSVFDAKHQKNIFGP